jgi:2-polyprenyl-3-methyl-5-hydroxy-6-metoxy-1,4-benzoquinol methylase
MYKYIKKNLKIYNLKYQEFIKKKNYVYEPFLDLIADIIKKYKYKCILDYGCGDGRFGFFFKKKNLSKMLIGNDISKVSQKLCTKIYDKFFINTGINLPKKKFDFIILNSVLEHIPQKQMKLLLIKISKKLKPGNGIFITIPNFYSPSRIFTSRWKNEKNTLGHINKITLSHLKKILTCLGFTNIQSSFHYKVKRLPDYIKGTKLFTIVVIMLYRLTLLYPFYYFKDSTFLFAVKK